MATNVKARVSYVWSFYNRIKATETPWRVYLSKKRGYIIHANKRRGAESYITLHHRLHDTIYTSTDRPPQQQLLFLIMPYAVCDTAY